MQKLVKPGRFVYNESLKDVIAYHDEDATICTIGNVLGVAAIVLGVAASIATAGTTTAVWLGAYAGASALFSATIGAAC